ncbi:MAG: N-6 DNA methylase [Hyphomonadaceae bacterium]|nr:N-6 DNA methylase [Hyphomonadaceae bacterium]
MARKAAAACREFAPTPTLKLRLCLQLLERAVDNELLKPLHKAVLTLDVDERHYWIGTFYTLLLSADDRRKQATYFTPPHLAHGVIALAQQAGFDLRKHSVIDPAAGGAAFLSMIAGQMRAARASSGDIATRLAGMEIDSGLARLAEALIGRRLSMSVDSGSIISHRDSLSLRAPSQHDLVIANPPYGRLLDDPSGHRWKQVCHAGHINKFALFAELCLRLAKPDGLVALVLPSSFVGGPLYDKLRAHIRQNAEVLTIAAVTAREEVFVDVQQDITVLLARAGRAHDAKKAVTFGDFSASKPFKARMAGRLPVASGAAWTPPLAPVGMAHGGATLTDYGADVRSGYFVWNREQPRMRLRWYSESDLPLIWATNIRAGTFCRPVARWRDGVDFVNFEKDASDAPIIRRDAVVLQRTTNSSQPRRLIAARVSPSVIKEWGGFVTENHTIVITAKSTRHLDLVAALLNSAAADARYRRLSGTASISVQLLRTLDLPRPEVMARALAKFESTEEAVEWAYLESSRLGMEAVA